MPAHWYLLSIIHVLVRLWCLHRASRSDFGWSKAGGWFPFLVLYLRVGLIDLAVWIATEGSGPMPRIIVPFLIITQLLALMETARRIHFLTPEHPSIYRHYRFAYFIALIAIAATARAVNYPGYPEWLFRAYLWTNMIVVGVILGLLALWWRKPFRMYPEVLWSAALLLAWSAAAVWASSRSVATKSDWVNVNETLQAVRIACLIGWGAIFRPTIPAGSPQQIA